MLTLIDEFTRECLAVEVGISIKSQRVRRILQRVCLNKGQPELIRSDNGSEFIGKAVNEWLAENGIKPVFIEPVSSIHEKIRNQRADFQHKLSTSLVKNFVLIAIEKLNIVGMSRGIFSKQIYDVAWSNFFLMLRYKAESADKKLIEVNPSRNISNLHLWRARREKTV